MEYMPSVTLCPVCFVKSYITDRAAMTYEELVKDVLLEESQYLRDIHMITHVRRDLVYFRVWLAVPWLCRARFSENHSYLVDRSSVQMYNLVSLGSLVFVTDCGFWPLGH